MNDELFTGDVALLLLVQGTACVAVGLTVSYVLRHRPAHAYQVLLAGLLAAVLMPGLYVWARHCGAGVLAPKIAPAAPGIATAGLRPTAPLADEIAYDPAPGTVAEAAPASPLRGGHIPWRIVAVACWFAATLALLLRISLRLLLGAYLLRTAAPLQAEHVARAIADAKSRLGIEKSVQIRGSEKVRSPVIWCWVREPVLLLHQAAADDPRGTDWAGVFCHELAHWRRRDHLSGLFAEVLPALFPWHPLLWWARRRLLALSEQACDDWVLATGHRGEDYAETLLGLAARRQMAFLPAVMGRERTMNTRIRRIIKDRCSNPRIGRRWTLGVSFIAILVSVGVALAQEAPASPQPVEPPPTPTPAPPLPQQQTLATTADETRFQIEAYPLKYISSRKLQGVAEILIGGLGTVVAHADREPLKGPLLVRTTPENHRRLEHLVLVLDVPPEDLLPPEDGRNVMQAFKLAHTRAIRLQNALRPIFEKSAAISADERTNSLVVTSREENFARIRVVITELDAPTTRPDREPEAWGVEALLDQLDPTKAGAEEQPEAEGPHRVPESPATSQRTEAKLEELLRIQMAQLQQQLQERKTRGEGDSPESRRLAELLRYVEERLRAVEQVRARQEVDAAQRTRRVPAGTEGKMRLEARVYAVEHVSPERVRAVVEALIQEPETVTLYANGRKATVVATSENHQRIERIIRIIDVPEGEYMADVSYGGGQSLQAIEPKYFSPQRLQNLLRAVLGQTGEVSLGGGGRTVFVAASNANMKRIESIVHELDVPMNDRIWATEVEELRNQMRTLSEQMRQIQDRLDRMEEQKEAGQASEPPDRIPEDKVQY
jgi:beta-lactamase regulating signal transducer with metallopeptidase domain/type II secretory pathway component GspD/PulD (secretin)